MPTGWYIVQPPVSSVLAARAKPATVTMAGAMGYGGSIAPVQLKKVAVTMAGWVPLTGPAAVQLKKLTFSLFGEETEALGGLAVTLRKVRPDLQQALVSGALSSQLKPIRLAIAGEEKTFGGIAATLRKVKPDFEQDLFTGALVSTLKPVKLAFALQAQGEIATRLADVDTLLASTQEITGALASRLQYARAVLAGAHSQAGTMAAISKRVTATMAGTVPGVTLNAVGTYAFGSGGGPISPTITINAGVNTRLYAIVTVTHTNWLNSYSANKPAATSNVNGVFGGRITNVWLGDVSGFRQGSIWLLELQNPTPGAHTVSVDCSASQGLSGIQAQLIAFDGVGSIGTIVTDSNPSSAGPPALAAAALRAIDMHLVIMTHNTSTITFSGNWPSSPGLFVNQFQSGQGGDAKACRAAYLQGDGASKKFNSTNPGRYAIAHIPLISP